MGTSLLCLNCQKGTLKWVTSDYSLESTMRCTNCGFEYEGMGAYDKALHGGKSIEERNNQELVSSFGVDMLLKLNMNNHKKHWSECSVEYLLHRIIFETLELHEALIHDDKGAAVRECADIANFAAMIADNLKRELRRG